MSDYFDIDVHGRTVTTASPEAQLWFDRGLVWCYGYWHEEAVACFDKAIAAGPDCAMAHWGKAYALGPNYNFPWQLMDPVGRAQVLAGAHAEMRNAQALAGQVTQAERALIEALEARYPQTEPVEDMRPWNAAFADAMEAVHRRFPDDLDVTTIYVEAIMNITPWKMWNLDTGRPNPKARTEEAQRVLERAMAEIPGAMRHPGVLHLYVHLMEMSPHPEKALKAGDVLRTLVPDAGHLIHMPTHIDVLCGHYRDVLVWNQEAIKADRKAMDARGVMNFYSAYRIHDYHFAIYGAMFLGQYEPALAAAEELIATTPEELLRLPSPPMADFMEGYLSHKQHVLVRFGKWREILAQEEPSDPDLHCATLAFMRYAKGVAHAALGEVAEAEAMQARFREAKAAVPESRLIHNNTCVDLLEIAEAMLEGEIEYRKGNHEPAFAALRRSVELDDHLPYDEPWGWMQPTRHALGALLLEQGHVEEAEAVYREDLGLGGTLSRATIHPDNVWSLKGLMDCLERRDAADTVEGRLIRQRLDLALSRADGRVAASCFCAQAAMADATVAAE